MVRFFSKVAAAAAAAAQQQYVPVSMVEQSSRQMLVTVSLLATVGTLSVFYFILTRWKLKFVDIMVWRKASRISTIIVAGCSSCSRATLSCPPFSSTHPAATTYSRFSWMGPSTSSGFIRFNSGSVYISSHARTKGRCRNWWNVELYH